MPRHQIAGGGQWERGRQQQVRSRRGSPGRAAAGRCPLSARLGGVSSVCGRRKDLQNSPCDPAASPGRARPRGPPTHRTPQGFSARLLGPCRISHRPPPRRGSQGTSRPPCLSEPGGPHPSSRSRRVFYFFFFPLLIFSSFPRSQKALQRPSSTCDFAAKVYLNDSKRVKLTSSRFCPVNPGPCGQP